MERSEPSLIPEWLKGASGGALASPQSGFYQDDGGSPFFPRSRATQQVAGGHTDCDSPRGSATFDRVLFPSARRGHGSNSGNSLERGGVDREHYSQGWSHSSLTRSSSSKRSYDTPEREWDGQRGDVVRDREWEQNGDRDFRPRERDMLSGFGSDERDRERDRLENGKLRISIPGMPGKYDADAKLRRSKSMGLSPRISDSNVRKLNEVVNISSPVPSVSGGLATSMQKAVFDRNFPSLGVDDKPGGLLMSSGNSSIASPRPLWQRELGRASSPGLAGGFNGPIPTTPSSIHGGCGGGDLWSSALAEVPMSNGNLQNNSLGVNGLPVSSSGMASSVPSPAANVTVLNMAEALTQNPPRVRTPPHVSAESQRLEELALKQSRQLIPMMPSLPKTMSLGDKAKAKAVRTVDGTVTTSKSNQLSGSLQLNSVHRSTNPTRPDTPKHSQGKLLVLKAGKDGGIMAATASKSEGSNSTQVLPHGNNGPTASTMSAAGLSVSGVIGQRKKSNDRRAPSQPGSAGLDALAGLRTKDPMEDKRSSIQAQNRSDFFNALRKKAAGNGSAFNTLESDSSLKTKSDVVTSSEAAMPEEAGAPSHGSEGKENSVGDPSLSIECICQIHSNGDVEHTSGNGLITDEIGSPVKNSSAVECPEESLGVDSEEEEAAFMRSLGWEENAEGSELTEEEINAFYQMRERKKLLNSRGHYNVGVEHCGGSLGSLSSGMSSSSSGSDDEPHT